mgnify:CR=1 FL=1
MTRFRVLAALIASAMLSGAGDMDRDSLADRQRADSSVQRIQAMGDSMRRSMVIAMTRFPWQRKEGDRRPPLFNNLGDYSWAISTTERRAQRYFDQGLAWAYGFNHAESVRAFRAAQEIDADCAMCFWGEAYALGPNINAPMSAQAVQPAYEAIQSALARADGISAVERGLIEATALRYAAQPNVDRLALDAAYSEALGRLANAFPDALDVAVLYAESLMNLRPWDYWEADGTTPKAGIAEAIAAVESVLATDPNHAGPIHFHTPLIEASATPERAESAADRLRGLVPGAGHLQHMPSHIYIRVGRHLDSMDANREAAAADEAFLKTVEADGIYPYGYYPHNVHFLLQSAQFAGDEETARDASEKLSSILNDDFAIGYAWEAILPAPYFFHAQFRDAPTILALPSPGERSALRKAMWHYARGVAHVLNGETQRARDEARAIADIESSGKLDLLVPQAVPAPAMAAIARLVVLARAARADGDLSAATDLLTQAVSIQDTLPYMEPPFWYYSVRQTLGAVLLARGQAQDAARMFEASLADFANNAYALYGLVVAHEQSGNATEQANSEARFYEHWAGGESRPDLERM